MKWGELSEAPCSIARSQAVLGDRWTILILRNAFMRTRRFDDFQLQLGITRHVLANRLGKLVKEGILVKVPYQEKPLRHEYRLTEQGRELHSVLMALVAWGDKWLDGGKGPPLEHVHKDCGHKFKPVTICSECHEPLDARAVTPVLGPGFRAPKPRGRARSGSAR